MATEQFSTVDEINQHYDRQIRQAGDDELAAANLRAERAERVVEFRDREVRAVQHRAWVSEAVAKHGIPEDLVDMIERFDNQEEINKAAERLAAVRQPTGTPSAEQVYGGSTAGGGSPIRTSNDPDADFLDGFERDWNAHEARSPRDFQRYIQIRLGRHTHRAMKEVGKRHIWDQVGAPEYDRY